MRQSYLCRWKVKPRCSVHTCSSNFSHISKFCPKQVPKHNEADLQIFNKKKKQIILKYLRVIISMKCLRWTIVSYICTHPFDG